MNNKLENTKGFLFIVNLLRENLNIILYQNTYYFNSIDRRAIM